MGKDPYYISQLIAKFLQGEATPAEVETLRRLVADDPGKRQLLERYEDVSFIQEEMDYMNRLNKQEAWRAVQRKRKSQNKRKPITGFIRRLGYAAAVLVICLVIWRQFLPRQANERIIEDITYGYNNDVLPGKTQAELILSNGKTIKLGEDSLQLMETDGSMLSSERGILYYTVKDLVAELGSNQLSNTIRVPRAGTYQVVLPDGTVVWLNAQSELTYPVTFAGNKREVTLSGEAHFDVAHLPESTFVVQTTQGDVQVLGTRFNVNTYDRNHTYTTLISGKVNIIHAGINRVIKPGQQAVSSATGGVAVHETTIEKVTAWRDGYFYFSNDPITSIMEQLARWYGVDVRYEGNIPSRPYGGSIGRDVTLGKALDMLKKVSGLTFQINGTTVIVKSTND
ncbi:FecR protein [Parapedobacter composti]|uniref:FecR protein n=1 Tax=Parapedobacter composti TaxID=623281 RepID=A0A1I1J6Y1_9SPHI|nr:FecR family protein [Parapedobacter composti]SFC43881.1 FecR protein [Parapedobacter composti]